MKKLLLAVLVMLMSSALYAQRGIEIGVEVIPQSTWIFNKTDSDKGPILDYSPTWGVAMGAHFGINFSDNIGAQVGFLYSKQGQKYENEGLAYTTSETSLDYIKFPFLLKFNSDPSANTGFVFKIGAQLGLLTSAAILLDEVDVGLVAGNDVKDLYNGTDLAAVIDMGVRFNVSDNVNIGVSFRADYSLKDIEDNKEVLGTSIAHYVSQARESGKNLTGGIQFGFNYVLH